MVDIVVLVVFFFVAIVVALRVEIGARSRAWQRIAEERRWDWERRVESSKKRDEW